MMPVAHAVTVAIPTYRRHDVLLDTIRHLLELPDTPGELLVLDQSESHPAHVTAALHEWNAAGAIRWIKLSQPSITRAMNKGLLEARERTVVFLDDDIRPEPGLIAAHAAAHARHPDGLVAGRVVQPWEEDHAWHPGGPFRFAGAEAATVDEFMGGNFSVNRALALRLGGFDENFVRVAYRFEAEFARRYRACGRRILFEPGACIHHLKAVEGGTRAFGEHMTTWQPDHAVGAYYFALLAKRPLEFLARPFASLATRYHLRNPWRMPATLTAEVRGMIWALLLFVEGPRRIKEMPKAPPS